MLFVNGLPLVVVELKSPSSEQATIHSAYQQFQTYKAEIPSLFRTNAALVISDGQMARIGSLTANAERFMRWRTIDGETIAPDGTPEQPVLVQGADNRLRQAEWRHAAKDGDDIRPLNNRDAAAPSITIRLRFIHLNG